MKKGVIFQMTKIYLLLLQVTNCEWILSLVMRGPNNVEFQLWTFATVMSLSLLMKYFILCQVEFGISAIYQRVFVVYGTSMSLLL